MPASKPNPTAYARRLRDAVENREPADAPELRAPVGPDGTTSETHAALRRRFALVETVLDAARVDPPVADLAEAVLATLRADPSHPLSTRPAPAASAQISVTGRRTRQTGWMLAVVAATLLVALVVLRRPIGSPTSTDNLADGTNRPATNAAPIVGTAPGTNVTNADPANEFERLFAEVNAAYRGLADETRVAVADLGELVTRMPDDEPAPVHDPERPKGWLDRVGGGLTPVRENVGRTLDFLLEPIIDPTTT